MEDNENAAPCAEPHDAPLYGPPWCDGLALDYGALDAVPMVVVGVLIALILCGITWLAIAAG